MGSKLVVFAEDEVTHCCVHQLNVNAGYYQRC